MFTVLKSFSGKVSGSKGHVIELKDKAIITDLLKAGYIEEYSEKNKNQAELKKENELGSIQLTEVGEDVSQGIFVQKGFYDKMNPNDEILLVAKDSISEETSEVVSDTEIKSPEFLQMLNSIK